MNDICAEQQLCEEKLQNSDALVEALCQILGVPLTSDAAVLAKVYKDLLTSISELTEAVDDSFMKKETALVDL
jgi:hypothetical protein